MATHRSRIHPSQITSASRVHQLSPLPQKTFWKQANFQLSNRDIKEFALDGKHMMAQKKVMNKIPQNTQPLKQIDVSLQQRRIG